METVKFVQTFLVLVGIFGVSNIRGSVSLKKRMNVFESRITTLEMRLSTENEMIKTDVAVLGQDVASLNNSVAFLEEICPSEGSQETISKTKKSQTQSAKLDEILQISNTVFVRGLADEKKWIRARLTKYENQMQKSINDSKSEMDDYKTEIDTKFSNETEWLRYKMDLYENEMRASFNENKNEMDSYMSEIDTKFSDEKEWLKSEVKKYKNETDSRLSKEREWLRAIIEEYDIEMFENFNKSKKRINDYISEIDARFSDAKELLRSKLDKYENEMHDSFNDTKSEMNLYKKEIDARFSNAKELLRSKLDKYENEMHDSFNNTKSEMKLYKKEIELRFSEEKQMIRDSIEECKNDVKTLQKEVLEIKNRLIFCTPGWTEFKSSFYCYVAEKLPYDSARDYCRKLNAHVADVESQSENDFLVKYVESIGHNWSDQVWIGLTDERTEGVWISDRTGRQTVFTNWRSGQPDGKNNGRDQNCVVIGVFSPRDQWNDLWCADNTRKAKFICKKDKVLI